MDFQTYLTQFEHILNAANPVAPYDNPDFMNYTRLNHSRMSRWLKKGVLTEEAKTAIAAITEPQHWILITEPWCGDAAHSVPFIYLMASLNPLITLTVELRDSEPHRIESYLTNGSKSIPKLIVQDDQGTDLAVWGPRPEACADLNKELKNQGQAAEDIKVALQNWYNANQGQDVQHELSSLVQQMSVS